MTRIVITGASGGLGWALALHYAAPDISLSLWGRNKTKLQELGDACQAKGAVVTVRSLDLADTDAAVSALIAEDEHAPLDMVIFASGLGDIRAAGDRVEDSALVARLATINFTAPASMATAIAGRMAARGKGSIALIGSAAAFHALPFAAAYCASKAGLARFAHALGVGARPYGVKVTLISPGFIDTAAGRRTPGPKPLLLQPEKAAERIARAIAQGKAHLITPFPFAVLRIFDRLLPRMLRDRLLLSLSPPG